MDRDIEQIIERYGRTPEEIGLLSPLQRKFLLMPEIKNSSHQGDLTYRIEEIIPMEESELPLLEMGDFAYYMNNSYKPPFYARGKREEVLKFNFVVDSENLTEDPRRRSYNEILYTLNDSSQVKVLHATIRDRV